MHWCRSRGHFWVQIYSTALQKKECKREGLEIMEYRTTIKYEYRITRVQRKVVKGCKCTGEQKCRSIRLKVQCLRCTIVLKHSIICV